MSGSVSLYKISSDSYVNWGTKKVIGGQNDIFSEIECYY